MRFSFDTDDPLRNVRNNAQRAWDTAKDIWSGGGPQLPDGWNGPYGLPFGDPAAGGDPGWDVAPDFSNEPGYNPDPQPGGGSGYGGEPSFNEEDLGSMSAPEDVFGDMYCA
jgi:hypothetical protein